MIKYAVWSYDTQNGLVDYDEACLFDRLEDAEAFKKAAQAFSNKRNHKTRWTIEDYTPQYRNITFEEFLKKRGFSGKI